MAKLGELSVQITANIKQFTKALGKVKSGVAGIGKKVFSLPGLAAAGGAGFVAKEILSVGDAYIDLDTRLTSLLGTSQEAAEVQEELFQMSQRTGSSVLANANSFSKLTIAQKMTGLTATENLEVLEGLNKIFAMSGASALDTSIAMRQLGQALASGRLQGDEFRSIAESTPMLLVELSKQLNVGVGDLKKMGSEGELTSDKLGKAFLNISRSGDVAFAEMPKTSARAFQRIINSAQRLWDHVNDNTGIIQFIADEFDSVAVWLEENEFRFIGWAQDIKRWLDENGEGLKQGIKEIFQATIDLLKVAGPDIKKIMLAMVDAAKAVLPWIAKIIESLKIAIVWWEKFFQEQAKQRAQADLESLQRGVIPEFDEGVELGARGLEAAGPRNRTSINNYISQKFTRQDVVRLNTEQQRQAGRS